MLPKDFPNRFFNPLTSKHRQDYIHVLLEFESVLEETRRIALPRNALMAELRRIFQRQHYSLDVSDEEDYDEEPSGDPEQDHLAFTIRLFLRSGWIDADESGEYGTETIFLTQYGKKLTTFLRDLEQAEDQSGHVVNTYSNLQQVFRTPENGMVCIRNAYDSTQRLLTNLASMFAKIKSYYAAVLQNTRPEELLAGHFYGYIRDVVDKLIFPIKVDDSVDRFKGPILTAVTEIQGNTPLLEKIVSAAQQTKRVKDREEGWDQLLKMLNYIKYNFDDIESYIRQLDDKNQTYIRTTRQKLTYMLSMDTGIKGNIVSLLRDAKERPAEEWMVLSGCFNLFDVHQLTEESFYRPRKQHNRNREEELEIESAGEVNQDEARALLNTRAARYTIPKTNAYAETLLQAQPSVEARQLSIQDDDDYLMAIFLALNSTDYHSTYNFLPNDEMVSRGRYQIPAFTVTRKKEGEK